MSVSNPQPIPRFLDARLADACADTPVVLIHGPRQCGKTTLARMFGDPRGYAYFNLDDDALRRAAREDPAGFVLDLPPRAVLDEVQRAPELFVALKRVVDRERAPGRFVLTGSAEVLLVPRLADSLAGRLEVLRLHPFAQCEMEGRRSRFLDALFAAGFPVRTAARLGPALAERILRGGFPAAVARPSSARRANWLRQYAEALVTRDVRDMSRIRSFDTLPRLLELASARTSRLLDVADLAAPFHLTRPTIADYVTLLERLFLLERVSPWHDNRTSRLIKTPKLHLGDTGLACALLSHDAGTLARDRTALGPLVETFVYLELRRMADWQERPIGFSHFRDKDKAEVDIVLERAGEVAGVEVKASATVTPADFRGLRKLRAATGERFRAGVVLYDGETQAGFGDGLFAVPIRALWETARAF